MSFFGGGTDFPEFFNEYGGRVISATFDKYSFITLRTLPSFYDYKTHITYSGNEKVDSVDEIEHPAVREALKWVGVDSIRLTYDADLPARSGLGTSSAFAVGLLNTLYTLKGIPADKRKLSDDAIYLERVLCREAGGIQDQIAAAYGGFNEIVFSDKGYDVKPVDISPVKLEELNSSLMLFFTGFSRNSFEIHKASGPLTAERKAILREMNSLTDTAVELIRSGDIDSFGSLLSEEWKLKRATAGNVSTDYIDSLFAKGISAGASGGKLLGAGGGGFLLFYVPSDAKECVRKAFSGLTEVEFRFENKGSSIIEK